MKDPHEVRKRFIEDEMLAGRKVPRWPEIMNTEIKPKETEELREMLCEALGWIRGDQGWQHSSDAWPSALPELDANLIQQAREKLLTNEVLHHAFINALLQNELHIPFVEAVRGWLWQCIAATPSNKPEPFCPLSNEHTQRTIGAD